MKIYTDGPNLGEVWYLSIEGFFSRGSFCRFMSKVPSVEIIRSPLRFSYFREQEFMTFNFLDQEFIAEIEPIVMERIEIRNRPARHNTTLILLMKELEKACNSLG